jgi:hypothetical protein
MDDSRVTVEPPADHGLCASCHERLAGRYCHRCGERVVDPHDYTIAHFAEQAFEAITQLDGKLWRSFRTLLRRPGKLTTEYLRGRRRMYMKPFAIFLVVNVAFLLLTRTHALNKPFSSDLSQAFAPSAQTLQRRVTPEGGDARQFAEAVESYRRGRRAPDAAGTPAMAALERYGRAFDARSAELSKSLVVLLIPMLAGLIMLLHFRPGRNQPYAKHLVLATHLLAAFLLVMLALEWLFLLFITGAQLAGLPAVARRFDRLPELLPMLVMFGYAYTAFRDVHGGRRLATALRAGALAVLLLVPFVVYRAALFLVTFYLS